MCERLDIKSCKDTEKLKKAKDEVYLKGFYEGTMLVGECKGMKVCDAKPIIRKVLMDSGDAFAYFEPENLVISRTGDEVSAKQYVAVYLHYLNLIYCLPLTNILLWEFYVLIHESTINICTVQMNLSHDNGI